LSPIEREFVRFIFSQQGQELVEKEGYVPISPQIAEQELEKVGIVAD
jgi:phosphate transport system substrate-binding protein